jgi:hypothetical protein
MADSSDEFRQPIEVHSGRKGTRTAHHRIAVSVQVAESFQPLGHKLLFVWAVDLGIIVARGALGLQGLFRRLRLRHGLSSFYELLRIATNFGKLGRAQ